MSILSEDRDVEVVVIVSHEDLSCFIDADSNWIVCQSLSSDLSQEHSFVREDFDTMSPVVRDEDLLLVIHDDSVGELEVFRTTKLLQNISQVVEDQDSHDFAFHDNDSSFVVDCDSSWMLQDVGSKLTNKLSVLIVDLDLMSRRSLSDNDVSRRFDDSNSIGIQKLSIPLSTFSELELESSFFVKDLNAMVVGVSDDDIILGIDCDSRRFRELTFHDSKLAKLAVIDHLLSLDLRLDGKDGRTIQ